MQPKISIPVPMAGAPALEVKQPQDGIKPLNIKKAVGFNKTPGQFKGKEFDNTLNVEKVGIYSHPPAEAAAALSQRKSSTQHLKENYYFIDWNNRVKMIRDQQEKARESKVSTLEYLGHLEQQLDQIKLEIDHIFGPGTDIFDQLEDLAISDSLDADLQHRWRNDPRNQ